MYCMPEEGTDLTPKDDLLTTAEILRLVSACPCIRNCLLPWGKLPLLVQF